MKLEDFEIGGTFICGGKEWKCTDKGTRIVTAICTHLIPEDDPCLQGPPYELLEYVFDEYDMPGCSEKD